MDTLKIVLGSLLLVVSSVLLLATGTIDSPIPAYGAGIAAILLTIGTLMVGTSGSEGRPV
jgi:hypothetical protein